MALLDTVREKLTRMTHQTSGGLLGGGGGGILGANMGVLQARIAAAQTGADIPTRISNLAGTLGARLGSGSTPPAPTLSVPSTDFRGSKTAGELPPGVARFKDATALSYRREAYQPPPGAARYT